MKKIHTVKFLRNILGIKIHHFGKKRFNKQTVNEFNDALVDLRNAANNKIIHENENPDKVIKIVEEVFDFNKQQKVKVLEILTPKQILQRLSIALAQIKADHVSENLLNEVCKIIYCLV